MAAARVAVVAQTSFLCAFADSPVYTTGGFTHFQGYCRDFAGVDVAADPLPASTLEACKEACAAMDDCDGIEWYPDTEGHDGMDCHKYPGTQSTGTSTNPIMQGGGRYRDAQCYIRNGCRNTFATFDQSCRDQNGVDVRGDPMPAGDSSLADCKAACIATEACVGIEWYDETYGYAYSDVKCHKFPATNPVPNFDGWPRTADNPILQGGGSYRDGECHVRHCFITAEFTHFEGYCRDFAGIDVPADPLPASTLEACKEACAAMDDCDGIEWYPDTEGHDGMDCHKYPGTQSTGTSTNPIMQGGGRYRGAQCYIRNGCRNTFATFDQSCRDQNGVDVRGDPMPAGDSSLADCKAACIAAEGCEGIEWVPSPNSARHQGTRCHKFPSIASKDMSMNVSIEPIMQGGGLEVDASCHVRHCFKPITFHMRPSEVSGCCTWSHWRLFGLVPLWILAWL